MSSSLGFTGRLVGFCPTGLGGFSVNALRVDPSDSSRIYAATSSSLIASTDGGLLWSEQNSGLRAVHVDRLLVDRITPSTLFAASSFSGLYRSGFEASVG